MFVMVYRRARKKEREIDVNWNKSKTMHERMFVNRNEEGKLVRGELNSFYLTVVGTFFWLFVELFFITFTWDVGTTTDLCCCCCWGYLSIKERRKSNRDNLSDSMYSSLMLEYVEDFSHNHQHPLNAHANICPHQVYSYDIMDNDWYSVYFRDILSL